MKRIRIPHRSGDSRVSSVQGVWQRVERPLGRRVADHPVVAAAFVLGAITAVLLALVVGAVLDARSAERGNKATTARLAGVVKGVTHEQALITQYLREANPAGRRRIKLECQEINAKFSMLEHRLDLTATASTDCTKLAAIGPKPKDLK